MSHKLLIKETLNIWRRRECITSMIFCKFVLSERNWMKREQWIDLSTVSFSFRFSALLIRTLERKHSIFCSLFPPVALLAFAQYNSPVILLGHWILNAASQQCSESKSKHNCKLKNCLVVYHGHKLLLTGDGGKDRDCLKKTNLPVKADSKGQDGGHGWCSAPCHQSCTYNRQTKY